MTMHMRGGMIRTRCTLLCSCLLLVTGFLGSLRAAEKPELTLLFPSGGQAGTTVDVTATGKFPTWPVEVWSDDDGISWSCGTDPGKLQANIAADAPPGVRWMRLHHADGASAARPFLVGSFPEASEAEPNDRVETALPIPELPRTLHGILNKNGDVDLYSVDLKQGELVAATVDSAKWLASPVDANVQFLDSRGFVISENIDHVGLDPYLEFQAPHDGRFLVRVFGFPATPNSTIAFGGGSNWVYRLRLDSKPSPFENTLHFERQAELAGEHIPLAEGEHSELETALAVALPAHLAGCISRPKQTDYIRFPAMAKRHYRMEVLAREFGSYLDPVLSILDASGKKLATADDVNKEPDPVLNWEAPADGDFTVAVSDFHRSGDEGYRYHLLIEERPASFSATVASELISVVVGKETDWVVNIEREHGFTPDIEISLAEPNEHLQCTSVVSTHGKDSASKVTLKLTGLKPFQGPVRFQATAQSENPTPQAIGAPNSLPLWLSVTAAP
ncbi:PPC domain-containing protein [Aureliella helgolandensis]|uniref:Uncharacterized protein n=1 Tax=Aureliella helgolandensis TaxID=2527968 RepID=A0A518G0D7_9BACT|nr:PPC domain-containing protein [Aureliella helgolandensis]QDV22036.1 hypothetical protein Q31a_03150 [Aureliella helgolandensis]